MPSFRSAFAFAFTLCAASNAFAQTVADPAEPIILHGLQLREQGREREALAEFTRAWEMGHTPRARAQMALVEQALGDWVTAYEHMTEALDARTDAWITSRRSVLDEAYAVIRQHVGRIDIVSEPYGAEVWVDGVLRGRSPLPRPIVLLVGAHVIEARMQGRVTTPLRVTIAADASRHEQVTLPPIVVEASPSPQPISGPPSSGHESGGGPGAGPWVLVGVGAAAVVAGAVFMVLRGNELEAAAHECNSTATDFQVCGDAEVTRGQYDMGLVHYNTAVTHSWIAGSAFAVGGAAMGAGLIWYVVARARGANPERPSASSRLRFFVAPHGDGAMIGLGGVM